MKFLILVLLATTCFADGPFGNVPGEPIKPLPHYTPLNPPKKKSSTSIKNDGVIFNALKTAAANGKKSVGGLNCTSTKCTLAEKGSKEYDDYSIYVALTVKPKDITSGLVVGSKTFEKQAGRLTCTETTTKTASVGKKAAAKTIASYSCRFM